MNKISTIHYCWFGRNPLPEKVLRCIDSWKKFYPDANIKCWNEDNFDVSSVLFTAEAYKCGRWAFVADYVRFYALYHEGGLYLDTDVEIIRPLDDLCDNSFMGFESHDIVNPGLVLFANEPHNAIIREVLDLYNKTAYVDENRSDISSPIILTDILVKHGLKKDNSLQTVDDVVIYPMEFFQPWGENWKKKEHLTQNTRTVHHYDASWMSDNDRLYYKYKMTHGPKKGKMLFCLLHPIMALKRMGKKR